MNFFAVQISLLASRLHLQRNWQFLESTDSHGLTKAKVETGNNMQMLVQVDRGWTGHKSDTAAGKTKSKPKVGGATAPYGLIPRRLFSNNFQRFLPNIISRSYGPGWKWFPPPSTGPVTPSCGSALNRTGGRRGLLPNQTQDTGWDGRKGWHTKMLPQISTLGLPVSSITILSAWSLIALLYL